LPLAELLLEEQGDFVKYVITFVKGMLQERSGFQQNSPSTRSLPNTERSLLLLASTCQISLRSGDRAQSVVMAYPMRLSSPISWCVSA
jgi:hypothetical protein